MHCSLGNGLLEWLYHEPAIGVTRPKECNPFPQNHSIFALQQWRERAGFRIDHGREKKCYFPIIIPRISILSSRLFSFHANHHIFRRAPLRGISS